MFNNGINYQLILTFSSDDFGGVDLLRKILRNCNYIYTKHAKSNHRVAVVLILMSGNTKL